MNIGIDIGGSHIGIGLINEDGKMILKQEQNIYINKNRKEEIPDILEDILIKNIEKILKNINSNNIEKIGITVPGTVSERCIIRAKNLFLEQFDISDRINKKFDIPIKLRNDAKCAAIAEKQYGSLKQYEDAVFLTIGTGIGGAVFLNNELLRPKKFEGFEIGHMIIAKDGVQCNCGKKGCFEKYASMVAFKSAIKNELKLNNIDGEELKNIVIEHINDNNINKIIEEYINYLAIGISNLIDIFEPEAICFGGGFTYYENIFLNKLKKKLQDEDLIFNKGNMPEFMLATLGNDAGIIGATL